MPPTAQCSEWVSPSTSRIPPARDRLDQHRRAGVAEGVPGERRPGLRHAVQPRPHRPGRRLAGDHQRPPGPAGQDHRAGQVDAVEEAVAGVRHVQRVRPAAERRLHDVRGGRLDHVPGGRGEQQQVDVERVQPGVGQRPARPRRRPGRTRTRRPRRPGAASIPVVCSNIPAGSGRPLAAATRSCRSAVVTSRSGRQLAAAVMPTRDTVEVMGGSLPNGAGRGLSRATHSVWVRPTRRSRAIERGSRHVRERSVGSKLPGMEGIVDTVVLVAISVRRRRAGPPARLRRAARAAGGRARAVVRAAASRRSTSSRNWC